MKGKIKVLCDFDGTAAANDVGNLLFTRFAGERVFPIIQKWMDGQISSKTCLQEECKLARVTKTELLEFVDEQPLDPDFPRFAAYCFSRNIELAIVSDGLDFYIHRILQNYRFDGKMQVFANHLTFAGSDRIRAEFPFFEFTCGQCANCKGYHVRQAKNSGTTVVYIGDGLSDRCGAAEADIVFAKRGRDLLRCCRKLGVPHEEFTTFGDLLPRFQRIVGEKAG